MRETDILKTPGFSSYAKIEEVGEGTDLGGNVLLWLDRLNFEEPMGHTRERPSDI